MKMSKRQKLYLSVIVFFLAVVVIRAQFIKASNNREVSSINSEWALNGIPVDVAEVRESDFRIYATVSGVFKNGLIYAEIPRDVKQTLAAGQRFKVKIENKEINGTIDQVNDTGSQLSGLYRVVLNPVLKDVKITEGRILTTVINTGKLSNILNIPKDAVFIEKGETYVWKLGADLKAQMIKISTGMDNGSQVEVKTGIAKGEKVVVSGRQNIEPGAKVRIHSEIKEL
jgi:multidrug efflux pump subunit AcrA (membrane-fusion protein)